VSHHSATTNIDRDLELSLITRTQAGDRRASTALVAAHNGAIWQVAHQWKASGIPLEDLYAHACIGFLEAIGRFDVTRGVRLLSYATSRMVEEVRGAVASQSGEVSLGSSRARSAKRAIGKAAEGATVEDIAASSGVSPCIVAAVQATVAFRREDVDGLSTPSFEEDVVEHDQHTRRATALRSAIASLTPQQQRVMQGVYGASDETQSLAAVALEMGLSRERVRQIHVAAMAKLTALVPAAMAETQAMPLPVEVPVAVMALPVLEAKALPVQLVLDMSTPPAPPPAPAVVEVPVERPALRRRHVLRLLSELRCQGVAVGCSAPSSLPLRSDLPAASWPQTAVAPTNKPASVLSSAASSDMPFTMAWTVPARMPSPAAIQGSHVFGIGRIPAEASKALIFSDFTTRMSAWRPMASRAMMRGFTDTG